jgi:hypothetical protein
MKQVCDSFYELKELCRQYGVNISTTTIYSQRLFGKSGVYSPTGEKTYLAYSENWCNRVLEQLRKDIDYTLNKYNNCYIELIQDDDIDTLASRVMLTECYGYRRFYLSVHAR